MPNIKKLTWFGIALLGLLAACSRPPSPTAVPVTPLPPATAVPDTPTARPSPTAVPDTLTAAAATPEASPALAPAYAGYELVTVLPRDAIQAIDDPQFLSAAAADEFYEPSEFIIGVVIDGDARAYSIPILSNHEVVNDTLGGRPIAVTWCPLCFSGIVYDRQADGRELTFGVSGKLIRNALVMYDRQTESYWSQLLGEAVGGEMAGARLAFVPSWMMTWAEWKALHPETVALDKFGQVGAADPYVDYYFNSKAGVVGQTHTDTRLWVKEFVVGVELADTAIAYPFIELSEQLVVNDTVGDTHLLVVYDGDKAATAVYARVVDGQTLTFSMADDSPATLVDAETGSTWNAFTGTAVDGPLAGQTLSQVKHTTAFWFGWKDFHPDTLIYGLEDAPSG